MLTLREYMMIFMGLAALSGAATADSQREVGLTRIDFICCTYHWKREYNLPEGNTKFNEKNFGLGIAHKVYGDYGVHLAAYSNSEYMTSIMVGLEHDWKINDYFKVRVQGGLVSGYYGGTKPYLIPSLVIKDRVNINYIPTDLGGISLSFTVATW